MKAGIDVDASLRSGQLDVRTWPEVYLVDGRLDPDRVIRQVVTLLDDWADGWHRGDGSGADIVRALLDARLGILL